MNPLVMDRRSGAKSFFFFDKGLWCVIVCMVAVSERNLILFDLSSLEGPLLDFIKKQVDQVGAEKSSLALKCRSIEDKIELLNKQLEASERYKSEYLNRYQDAIKDKEKLTDDYMSRINNLQKKYSSLEEKSSNLAKTLDTARQECTDWKRKYEFVLSKQKAEEDQFGAEVAMLRSKSSAAEARLAAAQEKAQSAHEEAEEWKRKYDIAVRETKNALEKAAAIQERTNYQTQSREAALREEFAGALAEKVLIPLSLLSLSLSLSSDMYVLLFLWR